MLKYHIKNFNKHIINMLLALIGKVDNIQEQMDNVSKEIEISTIKRFYDKKFII